MYLLPSARQASGCAAALLSLGRAGLRAGLSRAADLLVAAADHLKRDDLDQPPPEHVEHHVLHRQLSGMSNGSEREIYVMSIPDGDQATLECSECGPIGMIDRNQITAEQLKHRNYHRQQWMAQTEAPS